MRKMILSTVAALALGFTPMAASADEGRLGFFQFSPGEFTPGSHLDATVEFDKRVVVLEAVRKVKLVLVLVGNVYIFGRGAESIVVVNQSTTNNTVNTNPNQGGANNDVIPALNLRVEPFFTDFGLIAHHQLTGLIDNSLNRNNGIAQFNQDAGNNSNQGNTLSAAVAFNASFADSMASAQQTTAHNSHTSNIGPWGTQKYATIRNSGNLNTGVLMVNQNVGSGNNQLNAVSIAIGKDGAQVALSEADLGQFNTNNVVNDSNSIRRGNIVESFNGNTGIALGNQATGNHINQGTVISIAGAVR